MSLIVVSLFDSTGTWAAFAPPGATVYAVDLEPKPLEWSRARGVQHLQGDVRVVAWSVGLVFLLAGRAPRADVLLMAPPCQALARQRHLAGRQGGRTGPCTPSMTTEQGLELVHLCLHLAAVMQPRVWCLENPGSSLAWTVTPRVQRVLLGWWGFPALKPTGLGGDFELVALPFPLPEIDPTAGGRRPSGAVKGKGGVQAMPSYLRSRTPPDFARAWWTAQAPRLAGVA